MNTAIAQNLIVLHEHIKSKIDRMLMRDTRCLMHHSIPRTDAKIRHFNLESHSTGGRHSQDISVDSKISKFRWAPQSNKKKY
jgi:hypothetical protein